MDSYSLFMSGTVPGSYLCSASDSESASDVSEALETEVSDDITVSSGDAASADDPYTSAGTADYDFDAMLESLTVISDSLDEIRDVHLEGYTVISIFLGLIAGMMLVLGLWMGGRK